MAYWWYFTSSPNIVSYEPELKSLMSISVVLDLTVKSFSSDKTNLRARKQKTSGTICIQCPKGHIIVFLPWNRWAVMVAEAVYFPKWASCTNKHWPIKSHRIKEKECPLPILRWHIGVYNHKWYTWWLNFYRTFPWLVPYAKWKMENTTIFQVNKFCQNGIISKIHLFDKKS